MGRLEQGSIIYLIEPPNVCNQRVKLCWLSRYPEKTRKKEEHRTAFSVTRATFFMPTLGCVLPYFYYARSMVTFVFTRLLSVTNFTIKSVCIFLWKFRLFARYFYVPEKFPKLLKEKAPVSDGTSLGERYNSLRLMVTHFHEIKTLPSFRRRKMSPRDSQWWKKASTIPAELLKKKLWQESGSRHETSGERHTPKDVC